MAIVRVSAASFTAHLGRDVKWMDDRDFRSRMNIEAGQYTYVDREDSYYIRTNHPEWFMCYGGEVMEGMDELP